MFKAFRQAPFLRITLFFIAGILVQYHWDIHAFSKYLSVLALLLLSASFVPKINQQYNRRALFGYGILLLSFVSAVYLTGKTWKKTEWNIEGVHTYLVRVMDNPTLKPKSRMYKVVIISADSTAREKSTNRKAIIYLPKDSLSEKIIPGDCLYIHAALKAPQNNPKNATSDYSLYLRKQSYSAIAFVSKHNWQIAKVPIPATQWFQFKSLEIKEKIFARLRIILPDPQSFALAVALMFGYTNELDKDLRQSFSNIGAGHILVVSGLHFNLIFGMVYFLLSFIGMSKKGKIIKQLIVLPLIWIFAFISGLSPSVVRAASMLSLWGIGSAFFYKSFSLNTLASVAFFMLLYNPLYLFNIGFQLSFLAVLSILIINPRLVRLHTTKNKIIKYLWELICLSFSAQIGVLPLLLYYFHQFPAIFLLTNILLIPLSGLIMALILFSLLINFVLGNLEWLFFPLRFLMESFISTAQTLNNIPGGTISDIQPSISDTILFYVGLSAIVYLFIRKKTA